MTAFEPAPRKGWDEYFMDVAKMVATRSTCPRRHVGAVIVNAEHRILATGYNGSKPGEPHCTAVGCLMSGGSCHRTLHAEQNAIDWVLEHFQPGWLGESLTLYCTDYPCDGCVLRIRRSGIGRVVYGQEYRAATVHKPTAVE